MAYSQLSEDPFGDGPFEVRTQENFQAQQQGFAPASSFQPSGVVQGAEPLAPSKVETAPTFDFGDSLGGLTYTPAVANGHQESAANPPSMISEFPAAQDNNSFHWLFSHLDPQVSFLSNRNSDTLSSERFPNVSVSLPLSIFSLIIICIGL